MIVKRILHPVGHGAFFSEHFFEMGYDKNVFNVVYDCGAKLLPKGKRDEEIDNTFSTLARKHVDYLFISHLDDDHVNGIQHLVKNGWVDDMTTFVLPLFKDYELAIYDDIYRAGTLAVLDGIITNQFRRVIFVPMSDDVFAGNDYREIPMEADFDNIDGELMTVNGLQGKRINAASRFVWDKIWEYIPINLHDTTSKTFYSRINSHPDLQRLDLDAVKKIFKNRCHPLVRNKTPEQIDANKKFKALKEIYNSVGAPIKGDRLININSLAVVSQAVDKVSVKLSYFDDVRMFEAGFPRPFYDFWPSDGYGTCTYSGDLNLSHEQDFSLFKKKVTGVLRGTPELQLLQIPHHGSKTSYNKQFCEGLSGACFVNYNSGNNIFDQRIMFDFYSARKYLMPVTEIESSRIEQEFLTK